MTENTTDPLDTPILQITARGFLQYLDTHQIIDPAPEEIYKAQEIEKIRNILSRCTVDQIIGAMVHTMTQHHVEEVVDRYYNAVIDQLAREQLIRTSD